jgi:bifunctional non-homologous end joining protein LigD
MTTVYKPALAKLAHERFWDGDWIYERKFDGQRCLAIREPDGTRLYSRSRRDVTASFPEIAEALDRQSATGFVVDGEVVAFEGSRTSFSRLQKRIHVLDADRARATGIPIWFYVFDVLEIDDEDVRWRPLLDRKRKLRKLLSWKDPIRSTPHRVRAGEEYFEKICQRGWEGLIAKRADAAYPLGRTDQWQKFKCEANQELVVLGWTEPTGSRVGLGALLLGHYDRSEGKEDLVYAGKVGTGFSDQTLSDLYQQLSLLETEESPATRGQLPKDGVHWVRPELVAEVAFTEWTPGGQLRHPRYLGLRTDKPAEDVVREDL